MLKSKRTNRERALQVIDGMIGESSVHNLAKQAGLTVRSMVQFLTQAKKAGVVENRMLNGRHGVRICLWWRKMENEKD